MAETGDSVERMKENLYSRTVKTGVRPRPRLTESPDQAPQEWEHEPQEMPKAHAPRKPFPLMALFLGALGFFIVALGVAAYSFLYGGNTVSSENIRLSIIGPALSDGGKEVSLSIELENRNTAALELTDLLIEYPEGTRSVENLTEPLLRQRISLGTIASGGEITQTARAVLFGEEGSVRTIRATLEYRVAGSNATFIKEGSIDVRIGSSPVALSIEGPTEGIAGQEMTFTIAVRSNAQTILEDVALEAQYPFGFSMTGSSPETAGGEGIWQLGDIAPGEEKKVEIRGVLDGQNEEERVFRFLAGSEEDQTAAHVQVPYLTVQHVLTLKRPFINATISVAGDQGKTVVVAPGASIAGQIQWRNTLDVPIKNLIVELKFAGQALDRGSVIASRGFYRSLDSTIIWSKEDDASLADIEAGESGTFDFSFTPRGSSGSTVITNPEIGLNVSLSASREGQGNVPESIVSALSKTVRVGSAISLSTRVRHFTGPTVNSGPMPPKADQETTYTIVWNIKNPSNTVSGGRASATLPSYVRYLGAVSPSSETVVYDDRSRTVSWNVGDVKAGVGFGSASAREVSFKVGITPSTSQVGVAPALTGRVVFSGDDRFTGSKVSTEGEPSTTAVSGSESGYSSGMERVVP